MKKLYFFSLLALAAIVFTGCRGSSYLESDTNSLSTSASSSSDEISSETIMQTEPDVTVGFVQITGAVANPGVFEIKGDTRLFQIIEKAGGLKEDADRESINQAAKVSDGDNIHIRTIEESAAYMEQHGSDGIGTGDTGSKEIIDGKLNINIAGKESLMSLPGIGESKANKIIDYRDNNGSFNSIEDIKKIPGIKDGVYEKIKDEITVG